MNARATRRPSTRRTAGPRTMRSVPGSGGGGSKSGGCVVVALLTLAAVAGLIAGLGYAFAWVTA